MEGMYTVRGFAFNGGGDRIERVELSLDGGKTWRWCFRHFLDAPLRYMFVHSRFGVWGLIIVLVDQTRHEVLGLVILVYLFEALLSLTQLTQN